MKKIQWIFDSAAENKTERPVDFASTRSAKIQKNMENYVSLHEINMKANGLDF